MSKAMALVRKAMVTSVNGTSSRPSSGRGQHQFSHEEVEDDLIRKDFSEAKFTKQRTIKHSVLLGNIKISSVAFLLSFYF